MRGIGETASALARGRLHTPRPVATSALARPVRRGSSAACGKRRGIWNADLQQDNQTAKRTLL